MKKAMNRFALFFLLVLLSFGVVLTTQSVYANGSFPDVTQYYVYSQGEFDSFTNSDQLINNTASTILDYKADYWAQNVTHDGIYNEISVYGDDEIIQIVPRELFIHRGVYFIIGEEYAFFVHNQAYTYYGNKVTVLVIDIERTYDTSNPSTPSQISHLIKPVFEGTFYYLTNQDGYSTNEFVVNNISMQDSIIIPVPLITEEVGYYWASFTETTSYFIKDIRVNAAVLNEQHFNQGESSYDADEDKGSFFIESHVYYNGVGRQHFPSSIYAAFELVVGNIPYVSNIYSFLSFGYGMSKDSESDTRETSSYGEQNVSSTYASAIEQVMYNGFLNKAVSTGIYSLETESLLFGRTNSNNYVEVQYTLGQTENWYTSFVSSISMQIVRDDILGTTLMASETGYYDEKIRDIEYKEIYFETSKDAYSLGGGADYFQYQTSYAGQYTLQVPNSGYKIFLFDQNHVLLASSYNSLTYSYYSNQNYYIKIVSYNQLSGSFQLNVNLQTLSLNGNTLFVVAPYSSILIEIYANETKMNTITSTNTDVKVALLSMISNQMVILDDMQLNSLSYLFESGKSYYVMLTNNTSTTKNGQLNLTDPASVSLDQEINTIVTGDKFYAFTAPSSGEYTVSLFSNDTSNFTICRKGSTTPVGAILRSGTGYTLYDDIYLTAGTTIYIGYNNVLSKTLKFNVKMTDSVFTWYMNGNVIDGNAVYIKQGESANISAKIGDFNVDSSDFTSINSSSVTISGGILNVTATAYPTSSTDQPHHISLAHESQVHYLLIYIKANVTVTISPAQDLALEAGVFWSAASLSSNDSFILTLRFTMANGSQYVTTSSNAKSGSVTLPNNLIDSYDDLYANIVLESLVYKQYRGTYYADISIYNENLGSYDPTVDTVNVSSTQINTMFSAGIGTFDNPFRIKNERHLNNIRNTATEYNTMYYIQQHFVLMNSITLSNTWNPIDAPMQSGYIKSYNNALLKIYNFNINEQKGNNNIGFIRNMYGGTISYITLNGSVNVSSSSNNTQIGVGMFVGKLSGGGLINVTTQGSINVNSKQVYVGGITGSADLSSRITNANNSATISTKGTVGGIVGYISSAIVDNATNTGLVRLEHDNIFLSNVSENKSAGGIAGHMYGGGTIKNSRNTATIQYVSPAKNKDKLLDPKMGLIIGWKQSGTLSNNTSVASINTGNLNEWTEFVFYKYSQKDYIGGFIGKEG